MECLSLSNKEVPVAKASMILVSLSFFLSLRFIVIAGPWAAEFSGRVHSAHGYIHSNLSCSVYSANIDSPACTATIEFGHPQ